MVTDDGNILLCKSCLLSELLLERHRLIDIVLLSLCLGFLSGKGRRANLFSHGIVLLPDLLELLLLLPLFKLMRRQSINMILDDLLIEDLSFVDLLHQFLNSCLIV